MWVHINFRIVLQYYDNSKSNCDWSLYLSHTDAVLLLQPLKDNAKRLHMYFGNCDDWCPTSFYDEITKRVPEVDAVLCDKGYPHAYVINHSDEMAGIVVDWLKQDLVDSKPQWLKSVVTVFLFHSLMFCCLDFFFLQKIACIK